MTAKIYNQTYTNFNSKTKKNWDFELCLSEVAVEELSKNKSSKTSTLNNNGYDILRECDNSKAAPTKENKSIVLLGNITVK